MIFSRSKDDKPLYKLPPTDGLVLSGSWIPDVCGKLPGSSNNLVRGIYLVAVSLSSPARQFPLGMEKIRWF